MKQYQQEIRHILASLDNEDDEADTPTAPLPDEQESGDVVHVYPTEDGGVVLLPTELEPGERFTLERRERPPREGVTFFLFPAYVFLLLGLIGFALLIPPPNHAVSFTVSVPSVPLPSVTKVEKVTTSATGKGDTPATYAHGSITLYNGAIYPQIIPIGTVLKGADGIQVITDQQAVIPPVAQTTPPTDGYTSVPAHSLVAGESGDIPAGDINMACCVTSVIAQNPYTFQGGRNAQRFTYLTAQDVKRAASPLEQPLQTQTLALFPSPRVLNPTCTTTTQSTPQVGQTTQSAEVTVSETCQASSYNLSAVKTAITSYSKNFGVGTLSHVQTQIVGVQGTISLYVTATWNPIIVKPYPVRG